MQDLFFWGAKTAKKMTLSQQELTRDLIFWGSIFDGSILGLPGLRVIYQPQGVGIWAKNREKIDRVTPGEKAGVVFLGS